MDHAVPQGMDQGMDRGVWIVCGFGALIHTLYFDSYPYDHILTWLVVSTPLKNMSSSVGMMKFPIYGKGNLPNHQQM